MRSQLSQKLRNPSISAAPPPITSAEYSESLARIAASIIYPSPIRSRTGLPVYILSAAAFPDANEIEYDSLLPYVLARLPAEDELLSGVNYEVVFFAGGSGEGATTVKKSRPGLGWFIQAYHVLSRALRKRLQKLYIVHERAWIRILVETFSTIASPKFRKKIIHVSTISSLALLLPIEDLLIPPSAYLYDRRFSPYIHAPYASGKRAFSAHYPLPKDCDGRTRLPRVLRETTAFVLLEKNLKTEGLFRISPQTKIVGVLREAYDRGQKFIVWKDNGVALPCPECEDAENAQAIFDEIEEQMAYGVPVATSLIKFWYKELRQPLFPASSYGNIKILFTPSEDLSLDQLTDLISPLSGRSILSPLSRELLVRHLLPLLSKVSAHQEWNKMDAKNLAVCFAPALICGPDPIEDAKMGSIIRRILEASIDLWEEGLRQSCGIEVSAFQKDLCAPERLQDYEDPLIGGSMSDAATTERRGESEMQITGIILQDNDPTEQRPPLPPRPQAHVDSRANETSGSVIPAPLTLRRKPVPVSLENPPRYSTLIMDSSDGVAESPTTTAAVADGFAPQHVSNLPNESDSDTQGW